MGEAIRTRPATTDDAAAISSVLALNRGDRGLFQESATAVSRSIVDFFVACNDARQVVGCAGLHRDSAELAEIYAVAVTSGCQGQGIGGTLIQVCQQRARSGGIGRLWLATIKPGYFMRYGFQAISRWELPALALLRKLHQTFHQPVERWLPAFFGRHTFMRCTLNDVSDKQKNVTRIIAITI